MAEIRLRDIEKKYGKDTILHDVNLTIQAGSFTVLVGPSGCGKSTTLRMIAGLEKSSKGQIWIGNECVNDVPAGKRDIAMVFQNYALYPTMTVKENIEFGLKNRKVPKQEREKLILEICDIVGLSSLLQRKPGHLSGGQRQRVALARAMVKKPQVFLMDEPLSNLDAKLRHQMRTELIQLHKTLGTTFVYVTHDQTEAMSMGDEIVIMNHGVIQQVASPLDIYKDPSNLFAAQFIGTPPMNIVKATDFSDHILIEQPLHYLGFRPEKVLISRQQINDVLTVEGAIQTRETLGSEVIYTVASEQGSFMVKSFSGPIEAGRYFFHIPFYDLYGFDREGNRVYDLSSIHLPRVKVGMSW